MQPSNGTLPLEGLRVLDLTRLLPGPYASLVLADLGAQVDKVEEPGGDPVRHLPPFARGQSATFAVLHRNKRSVVLDLKRPEGVAALRRLVPRYDVLLESFRPGVMERLGLSYPILARDNPRLVVCSISGFGQTGPDRTRAGHDLGYLARAGVLGAGGPRNGPPGTPGGQAADIGGGLFALVGLLAALYERGRTGKGRYVDISLTEAAVAFHHHVLAARLWAGSPETDPLERGTGALNGGLPCYGVYETSDRRYLAVAALEPKFFERVCETLARPDLIAPAYAGGAAAEGVRRELERLFAQAPLSHWLERFHGVDACVEPVWEGDEVLSDPQHLARGLFVPDPNLEGEDSTPSRAVAAGGGFQLKTPVGQDSPRFAPAPGLGQHTRQVLSEAGFTDAEVAALLPTSAS